MKHRLEIKLGLDSCSIAVTGCLAFINEHIKIIILVFFTSEILTAHSVDLAKLPWAFLAKPEP
jgi:hypothetical protein